MNRRQQPRVIAEAYLVWRRKATRHKCGSLSALSTEQAVLRLFPLLRPDIAFHLLIVFKMPIPFIIQQPPHKRNAQS